MKINAVIGNGKDITVPYQSCYCKLCFEYGEFNFWYSGWNFHQLNFPSHHHVKNNDGNNDVIPVQCTTHPECEAGDFIVCVDDADKKIYFGKVREIDDDGDDDDDDDDDVLISFMSPDLSLNLKMQSFRWPTCAGEILVKRNSIFINIPPSE